MIRYSKNSTGRRGRAPRLALLLLTLTLGACNNARDTDSLMAQARQYRVKGETKAAIIELKNALQKTPDDARARLLLGEVYIDAGDVASAEKEVRKAQALGMFYGESMFARVTDGSKIALAYLVRLLRQHGVKMIDCQQETGHLASLGAAPIPRAQFLAHLRNTIELPQITVWEPIAPLAADS